MKVRKNMMHLDDLSNKINLQNVTIDELSLSLRSLNALKNARVLTVDDLLKKSDDEIYSIRNIGAKSAAEIINIKNSFMSSGVFSSEAFSNNDMPTFIDEYGMEYFDVPITKISLSVRAVNCLLRSGIEFASQIRQYSYDDFMSIKNMGIKTAEELVITVKNLEFKLKGKDDLKINVDEYTQNLILEISTIYNLKKSSVLNFINQIKTENSQVNGESLIREIYKDNGILNCLEQMVLGIIKQSENGIEKVCLKSQLPSHLFNTTIIDELLIKFEQEGLIFDEGNYICFNFNSVEGFAHSLDEKNSEILIKRLQGQTLEQIGCEYGITRERVRQILEKVLKKAPILKEDKYLNIYSKYLFSLEDFQLAFSETQAAYYYLETVCKTKNAQKRIIDEALEDENIPIKTRKQIERAVYKNYINTGTQMLRKDRPTLIKYAASIFAKEKIKFDDFVKKYHNWLSDNDLNDEKYMITTRTYENQLNACDYALWNHGRSFRYYDIKARDYKDLIGTLNIEQYEDIELSAYKFFRDYPVIMREYDIHDENELHNLLKKVFPDNPKIVFGKMPTIIIGNGDTDKQAYELMSNNAPISINDLAMLYEETYGIKANTAMVNLFGSLSIYYHEGVYSIDYEDLLPEEADYMKNVLSNDFYMLSDVQKRYTSAFPKGNKNRINPYSLKKLGFKVYSQYVIKNKYSGVNEYVQQLLLNDDFVNLEDITNGFQRTSTFSVELHKYRANYEIVEYAPKQYINCRRLKAAGVEKSDLKEYCNSVKNHLDSETFFTIHSLNKGGFEHPLNELGFEKTFYAAILTEDKAQFTYFKMANEKVFFVGNKEQSFREFLEYIFNDYDKIDIYDLIDLLNENYGLIISKDKLSELLKRTSLYYSPTTMDMIYIDYNTYLEEI